ncbi:hypothetical protein SADUNF_Sadunf04G0055300 [Salix dunnii]|uniref:Glutathione S-transferase n=1 Tax=Salix dunnii TaxID=1413687 RepID=A0A835KEY4_9ROSI|nr:hypothetical protein SADUNF_Sadunf04G0055300 [Salix dunnii]
MHGKTPVHTDGDNKLNLFAHVRLLKGLHLLYKKATSSLSSYTHQTEIEKGCRRETGKKISNEDLLLLDFLVSPFCMRVKIALAEKGLRYESKEEDLFGGKSGLVLKSNPIYQKVPVLLHNACTVCKSTGEAVEVAKKDFIEVLKVLEEALGENNFGGETFGFVDIVAIPMACWFYASEKFGNFTVEDKVPNYQLGLRGACRGKECG